MSPLACGVAILDAHTRLARLETDNTSLLAALGAAATSLSISTERLLTPVGCLSAGGRNRYYVNTSIEGSSVI